MKKQNNYNPSDINQYFDNILKDLSSIEQAATVLTRLSGITDEVQSLKKYVKAALHTMDNHFQAYLKQINVMSGLIEFQQEVIRFKSAEEMVENTFRYLKSQVNFDGGFFYVKSDNKENHDDLLTVDYQSRELYETFTTSSDALKIMRKALSKKERAFLLEKEPPSDLHKLPWHMLGAKSTIIFPLRIQNNLFGFGVLFSKQEDAIPIEQLSFINLILGLMSLMIFQHYYFYQLKQRFLSQSRLHKAFDDVQFGDFFDRGPLHIYSLDENGVILHANTTAMKKPGFISKAPVGEKFVHFLPEEQQETFEKALSNIEDGQLLPFPAPVFAQNGTTRVWEMFLGQVVLQQNFKLRIVIGIDITAQYFREQVRVRNEVLDQAVNFSTVISRHLNELLAIMVPNVSILHEQLPKGASLQKHVVTMQETLEKTESLMRKFLTFDLPEVENLRKANLNRLIKQVVSHFQEKLGERVKFELALSKDVPALKIYVKRMLKLIKIFTSNSLEALHRSDNPKIKLSTRVVQVAENGLLVPEMYPLHPGKYVEIRFTDNGPGIKPELFSHIFKPFFSTKIKNDGTAGLGLFFAYNIVKEMNGEIFVSSVPGKSTSFLVYLPCDATNNKQADDEAAAIASSNGKTPPGILVVDDEYNIRSVLQEILESHGYRVFTAENGLDGVVIFKKYAKEIDLVILDMRMPVMGGAEAFTEIRRIKPDQKVIVISGFAPREELQQILNKGALGYLSKPFQIEEILKKVQSAIERDDV
jgi:signal transduction histidine kinase/CheY-like chemotaxis protein